MQFFRDLGSHLCRIPIDGLASAKNKIAFFDSQMMDGTGNDLAGGKGIASAVTSRLGLEILALGKVPFYCAAWSNIKSVRNAIKSGFRPAWVELTARNVDFINKMIR